MRQDGSWYIFSNSQSVPSSFDAFCTSHQPELKTSTSAQERSVSSESSSRAAAVSATSVVAVVCHQHFFFASWRQGLRARAATVGLLFHKSLRLSMVLDALML